MKSSSKMWVALAFMGSIALPHTQAQNDIMLTQQWLSRINMNPAATGNTDNIDVYALVRRQWSGFENAPKTEVLNIHSYFHRIQSGLGLSATHDNTGLGSQMINAKLAYAYHVNLGEKWLLSLGLSGGIIQQSYDPTQHYVIDPSDDAYMGEKISQLNPDADFGFELNSQRFQLGASVTHLIRMPDKQTTMKSGQQYHAYVNYKQPFGESFDLTIGARGMNIDSQPYLDVHLTAMIGKVFWIGGAYRPVNLEDFSPNTIAAMIGIQVGFARIGYAYDHSIGKISSIAQNSHEVMLSLKIGKPKKTINTKSPRFIEE